MIDFRIVELAKRETEEFLLLYLCSLMFLRDICWFVVYVL